MADIKEPVLYIKLEDARQAMFSLAEHVDSDRLHIDDIIDALENLESVEGSDNNDRTETGWISVKERLPDKEEKYYLCYAKGGYPCLCLWTDDIFGLRNVYINSEKKFGGEWGWSVHTKPRYDTITHWMPLPTPPEAESEAGET